MFVKKLSSSEVLVTVTNVKITNDHPMLQHNNYYFTDNENVFGNRDIIIAVLSYIIQHRYWIPLLRSLLLFNIVLYLMLLIYLHSPEAHKATQKQAKY